MDYSKGYSCEWRLYRVNPDTWADAELVSGFRSASVERDVTGDAPLVDAGSIELDGSVPDGYYRIAMTATQGSLSERVDVATLLCCSTSGTAERGSDGVELVGRSVLWPASTRLLTRGSYAPAGVDGAQFAAQMIRECCKAPVTASGSFTLDQHIVFDLGASYLEAVWSVLNAANWCMRMDGRGQVEILPKPTEPSLVLSNASAALLQPGIDHTLDTGDVPNRYTAIEDGSVAQAVNDDLASSTSYQSRGYWVDVVDDSPERVDGETLTAYATRRLREESTLLDERTYTRELYPGVLPFDIVRCSIPSVTLDGDMRVRSQSLECGHGIVVTEKSAKEVTTWQG